MLGTRVHKVELIMEKNDLAQIAKLEAETELVRLQIVNLRQEKKYLLSHPYIRLVMQSVVAGAIFSAAFFFLYQPIVDANKAITTEESNIAKLKAEQANLRSQIQEENNRLLRQANERQAQALREENLQIKTELDKLVEASKSIEKAKEENATLTRKLKEDLVKLESAYSKLSIDLAKSKEKRDSYFQLAEEAKEESLNLVKKLEILKNEQEVAKARTTQIQEQIQTRKIQGKIFVVAYDDDRKDDAIRIGEILTKAGAIVEYRDSTQWIIVQTQVIFYPDSIGSKAATEQARTLLLDFGEFQLIYHEGIDRIQLYLPSKAL